MEYEVPSMEYAVPSMEFAVPSMENAVPYMEHSVPCMVNVVHNGGGVNPSTRFLNYLLFWNVLSIRFLRRPTQILN